MADGSDRSDRSGRYVVLRRIGEGAMGVVYSAYLKLACALIGYLAIYLRIRTDPGDSL